MTPLSRGTVLKFYTYLPVIIVGMGLVTIGFISDRLNTAINNQHMRDTVLEQVSVIRARLEGSINSNAQLVRGLVAAISIEPEMSKQRYIALSTPLLKGHSQLRNIAAAPGLVISYMNPVAGNEAAIGLDYRKHPEQFAAVSRARDLGELIIAGPVDLVQGGQGFIARIPVFMANSNDNKSVFWGMVSAVIDVEKLYNASGVYDIEKTLQIAIRGKDATGSRGELIYGNNEIFAAQPVLADITLPYGTWQIAAIPAAGWAPHAQSSSLFRIGMIATGLVILIPLFFIGRIMQKKRVSETRMKRLFELSPVGIALNDYDTGEFIEVNQALLAPSGYTHDEFVKLSYWDITPAQYNEEEALQLKNLKENGRYGPYEKEYIRKDGSRYEVRLNGIVVEEPGTEKMIWSFVEDISKQKQAEKHLQHSQKMEAIGQLTGGIAHDFNNILGIIIGNLDLLKINLSRDIDKSYQRIDTAIQAGKRAADLTRKLLSFSRNTAGQEVIVDVNRLIKNIENLVTRSVTPAVEVSFNFADNLWPTKIDSGDFEDAVLNLCINARDAMESHGHLVIETRNVTIDHELPAHKPKIDQGEYIELSVSDDGCGMTAQQQEHIFEPFYTTKKSGKGTGLGMAMVYGFVKRSNGFIEVHSQPGTGTRINIFFPRANDVALNTATLNSQELQELPGGNETILVVDDEIVLLELARELLQSMGYRVLTASNGTEALQVIDRHPDIQLLFSDVVMPGGINGYQLAAQAIAKHPKLKVLLTSGYTGKAAPHRDSSLFNTSLLGKPYRQQDLALRVRTTLDHNDSTTT